MPGVNNWHAEVYSMNTDSWKEIKSGDLEVVRSIFRSHASFNGSIFWPGFNSDTRFYGVISFDMTTEVFKFTSTCIKRHKSPLLSVSEHNKKLVFVYYSWFGTYDSDCPLWVMEEGMDASGKICSWRKIDNSLYLSDFSSTEDKINTICERHDAGRAWVSRYIESLVPTVKQEFIRS